MNIIQLLLIVTGLVVAAGGVLLLVRSAGAARRRTPDAGVPAVRPYVPLGVIALGLFIAYHSFMDFATFDSSDVTMMFAFCIALALLMGLRFFLVDKVSPPPDDRRRTTDDSRN